MAETEVALLPTDEHGSGLSSEVSSVEDTWNSDVGDDHEVDISEGTTTVDLGDPDDFDDAWDEATSHPVVQNYLTLYDAVIVVDDRSTSGPNGRATVGTAGGYSAYAYSEQPDTQTIAHELGHLYGCSHEGDETHWRQYAIGRHDVMGYRGVDPDCQGGDPSLLRRQTYRSCAAERIRNYVDDEL